MMEMPKTIILMWRWDGDYDVYIDGESKGELPEEHIKEWIQEME